MNIAFKLNDIFFAFCVHKISHLIIELFTLNILYWDGVMSECFIIMLLAFYLLFINVLFFDKAMVLKRH